MKVKISSAINSLRELSCEELVDMALEENVPVTYLNDLLDKYKNVTLELEIKRLDKLDLEKNYGAYVGHTLDAINYEFFDAHKIRLKGGVELLFPLTVELPNKYCIMIYAEDLPKYEQIKKSFKEKGVTETVFDILSKPLGIERRRFGP